MAVDLRANGACAGHASGCADPALLACIRERLEPYRRIGHDVRVIPARQVPLEIRLTVCVLPAYLCGHVQLALRRAFSAQRLPNGQLGFFHPDHLTFGQGVYVSQLIAHARAVLGVENVAVDRLQRYKEPSQAAIEEGVLPLAPFEVARLDNDPNFPENGVLEFEMLGGREGRV